MDGWLAKHRWLVLLSISAGSCICYIPYAWSAFQPLVAADLGYATDAATAVIPCCSLFYGLLSVLGGQWHNRSPQSVYLIGATAISCSYLLFCLSPPGASFFPVLCFGLTFGVGYGLIYSAATPCLLAWFPDRRGFAIGTMAGASGIFLSVFTYWGTDLVTRVGTRQGFLVFGLISAVVLFSTAPVIGIPPHTSQIRSRQPTLQLTDSTNGLTSRQNKKRPSHNTRLLGLSLAQALVSWDAGSGASIFTRLSCPQRLHLQGRFWAVVSGRSFRSFPLRHTGQITHPSLMTSLPQHMFDCKPFCPLFSGNEREYTYPRDRKE